MAMPRGLTLPTSAQSLADGQVLMTDVALPLALCTQLTMCVSKAQIANHKTNSKWSTHATIMLARHCVLCM
jgi:hypothetical protein